MHFLGVLLQTCFWTWWTGPHRPLHVLLTYHPSWCLSHFLHTWENPKVVEGPGLTLDSKILTYLWYRKDFFFRIISYQMVYTWDLSAQALGRSLGRERPGGHLVMEKQKMITLQRNLNSLLASTLHFSRLPAQTQIHSAPCRCPHDAVGFISW